MRDEILIYFFVVPGVITSCGVGRGSIGGGMGVGERLSASGTHLNAGSPVQSVTATHKMSSDSLHPPLKSVSKQSLLGKYMSQP